MPLVVPGITSNSGGNDKQTEWMSKLMGKKIGDNHNEQVFAKKDLPAEHRVLGSDSMSTMDFKPDRLNIHTDNDGTVKKVTFG